MKPVRIVGGGLAGLSLGRALARQGAPVVVEEAGSYPRHRVCGEFIAGLDDATVRRLDLDTPLADALSLRGVAWCEAGRVAFRSRLPAPARGLARHTLDAHLADDIRAAGGAVRTNTRGDPDRADEGAVVATGRRPGPPAWIGLKQHALGLDLLDDLELHVGDEAYCGVSRLPDGRANVCGLFRLRAEVRAPRERLLTAYLDASGLGALAARVRAVAADPESHSGVAGLRFSAAPEPGPGVRLGDAGGMIPPFTGNGMAMAFQSAASAVEPLLAWSRGTLAWDDACAVVRRALRRRFSLRLRVACRLHALVLRPRVRRPVVALASAGLLPFRLLYSLTH